MIHLLTGAAIALRAPPPVAVCHYFTCRHTYEETLCDELEQGSPNVELSVPEAAIVKLLGAIDDVPDPAYALQILPHAIEVRGSSINILASAAAAALGVQPSASPAPSTAAQRVLSEAPRGSLRVHTLVPDVLRGVPHKRAKLLRRCEAISKALVTKLRARYACARQLREDISSHDASHAKETLLQLLLLNPELLVISAAPCIYQGGSLGSWPSRLPGGLVSSDLDGDLPSSAYRKLLESFAVSRISECLCPLPSS